MKKVMWLICTAKLPMISKSERYINIHVILQSLLSKTKSVLKLNLKKLQNFVISIRESRGSAAQLFSSRYSAISFQFPWTLTTPPRAGRRTAKLNVNANRNIPTGFLINFFAIIMLLCQCKCLDTSTAPA